VQTGIGVLVRTGGTRKDALSWLPPRWLLAVLTAWTAASAALSMIGTTGQKYGGGIDWRAFLMPGSRLLYSGAVGYHCPGLPYSHLAGGLHLYASYPCLQIGPLAFVVAGPIRLLSPHNGLVAAELIMSAIGLVVLLVLWRIMVIVRPGLQRGRAAQWTFLAGSSVLMITWETLAVADGHLDDVLTLLFAALAVLAGVRGRPVLTGLAIGLAVDAKPWALIFLPVLLLAAGLGAWRAANLAGRPIRASIRPCLLAGGVAAVVIAAGWLPFYLADHGTSAAFHFQIYNSWASGLRVLGVHPTYSPSWVRPVQIVLGCLLGTIAIWRGRWPAVLLLGAGARIALDPGTHGYYTPGLLVGALLWDLVGTRRPVPVWTLLSYCALNLITVITPHGYLRGDVRFGLVAAFTAVIMLGPRRWCWQPPGPELEQPGDSGLASAAAPATAAPAASPARARPRTRH
jgi:hypothetical protein